MAQGAAFGPMDGADGADGAEGFETLDALGGGRRSVFRPIGAAPESTRRAGEADYRSHRWPPRLPGNAWPPVPPTPPNVWPTAPLGVAPRLGDFTPDNASLLVLAQMVQLRNGAGKDRWTLLLTRDPANAANDDMANDIASHQGVAAELAELRLLAQFRAGAMSEALAQRNGIIGYFRGLLHFNLATHPYTYYLAAAALRVGQFLCMHYKGVFNRPRPMRLDPSVLSPIDPPGHSAYPSGHAIQAFLIARCLEQVVPAALGTALGNQSPFRLLAERIAKLREVLGVHYPSDTTAGRRVAQRAFPLLLGCELISGRGIDADGDGVIDNQIKDGANLPVLIDGQAIYDNGWLALARKEWN